MTNIAINKSARCLSLIQFAFRIRRENFDFLITFKVLNSLISKTIGVERVGRRGCHTFIQLSTCLEPLNTPP